MSKASNQECAEQVHSGSLPLVQVQAKCSCAGEARRKSSHRSRYHPETNLFLIRCLSTHEFVLAKSRMNRWSDGLVSGGTAKGWIDPSERCFAQSRIPQQSQWIHLAWRKQGGMTHRGDRNRRVTQYALQKLNKLVARGGDLSAGEIEVLVEVLRFHSEILQKST